MPFPPSGRYISRTFGGIPHTDAAFGAFPPTQVQKSVIDLARAAAFGNGYLRNVATYALLKLRAAPIDHDYFGLKYRFYLGQYASARHMLLTPNWSEVRERAFVIENMPENGTFLDLGCNAGFYLFHAAAHRPNARIIGFEPVARHFGALSFNIRNNNLSNVEVLNVALSDREGEIMFDSVEESIVTGGGNTYPVKTRPLLAVLQEREIKSVNCMKIDVEGAEDSVLMPFFRAAPPTLWPQAVIIEDNTALWKENCVQFMLDNGYREMWRSRLNIALKYVGPKTTIASAGV
jgi:FkbM family methyltransferase